MIKSINQVALCKILLGKHADKICACLHTEQRGNEAYLCSSLFMDYFISADSDHLKREKAKARELRDSAWWKRKRASGVCYYCGSKVAPSELTMDHLIPITRGGTSVRPNLVPACKECNNKKKYLLPTEWTEYLDSLQREPREENE